MRSRLARIAAPAGRVVRGIWPDRNPLRRGLDRAEAHIVAALSVVFLVAAPLVAQTGGDAGYRVAVRTAHAGQSWRQVSAVLLATARLTSPPVGGSPQGQAVLGAVLALTGLGCVLCCAGLVSHALLGRRRLAAWEPDCQTTESQWTGGH
jgi:hypothetical protein